MDGSQPQRADSPDDTSARHSAAPAGLRTAATTADERSPGYGIEPRATALAPRRVWHDTEQTAARLTAAERETLTTLIRVPFATATLLEQLRGLRGVAALYCRLARLRAAGLAL